MSKDGYIKGRNTPPPQTLPRHLQVQVPADKRHSSCAPWSWTLSWRWCSRWQSWYQLGQVTFMQYFGGAASSMDHQHEFRQAGISWEVLATVVALGRWAGQNGVWQVIWCLGRLSPLQKAFPQVLQVCDDGKCTKLSLIKRFQKFSSRVCMRLGLCASLQCDCLTSSWQKDKIR